MPDCLIDTVSVATGTVPLLQLAAADQLPPAWLTQALTLGGAVMFDAALVPGATPVALALSV